MESKFQHETIKGQVQFHISYCILSLWDMAITIKSMSMGSMKIKGINWLGEVDFHVKASACIQDTNMEPLCRWLRFPALL